MPDNTKIEWCDATINPYPGCSRALLPDGSTSPACVGCYAERIAARMSENPTQPRYHGLAVYDDQRQVPWSRGRLTYGGGNTTDSEVIYFSPACNVSRPAQQHALF